MANKTITLDNIFLAIKINCLIDPDADKPLTLVSKAGAIKNRTLGRTLFLHFALKAGHGEGAIRFYLDMTTDEYNGKVNRLPIILEQGRHKWENDPNGPEDPALFFYRKLMLVSSYLRYNHQFNL